MSASILHHIHGIKSVKYKSIEFIDGMTIFKAELDQTGDKCSACKSSHLQFKGARDRRLQMCPTGSKPCWLYLILRRRKCANCRHIWWPEPSFASGQRRMVRSLENY